MAELVKPPGDPPRRAPSVNGRARSSRAACSAHTIVVGDTERTTDDAIKALSQLDVFQRAGALVDVVREPVLRDGVIRPEGAPSIRKLPPPRLREMMGAAAAFVRMEPGGDHRRVRVPADVVRAVEARGQWHHIRPLDGVAAFPVLRPDGTVLTERGYDMSTRLLCELDADVQIPERPTPEDAKRAIETLRELTCDFPFASEAHRSAWMAALLTVLARPAIGGPVPLVLIDANARGAGKTLLADLLGTIVTGQSLPRRTVPVDGAEWRKSMLAIGLAGDPVLLLDNVVQTLRSDVLDAVLTGATFRERRLGENAESVVPIRTLFVATSNNATLSSDLVRRSLHVRIEARDERPEARTGWRHPDLLGHARHLRAELLSAAMTVLRAHAVAGSPRPNITILGGYERWADVVQAALVWAGAPDPGETQAGLRDDADPELEANEALLTAWFDHYGPREVTVAQLLEDVSSERLDERRLTLRRAVLGFVDSATLPSARKLGVALRALRGRIAGGYAFESGQKSMHGARWKVRREPSLT